MSASSPAAEEVWNEELLPGFFLSGGGGFSNRFSTPSYQKTVVQTFLGELMKTDPAHLSYFNTQGVSHGILGVRFYHS